MFDKVKYSRKLAVAANQNFKERDYWLKQLSGELAKSSFPYDDEIKMKEPIPTTGTVTFNLTGTLFSDLKQLVSGSDYRLHMTLAAGLTTLLHKYTGSSDIIVGTPIYKQNIEGEFINTVLPLRNQIDSNTTFKQLLLQVRQTLTEAIENYSYPMEILIEKLNIHPHEIHPPLSADNDFPLFDVALLLENVQDKSYIDHIHTNMIFSFLRHEESVEGVLEYNPQRYKKPTVKQIINHLQNIMQQTLSNPGLKLSAVDILSVKEKQQLLNDFNDTKTPYPHHKTIQQLFTEQAQRTPDQIALVGVHETHEKNYHMSYKKLNKKSNQLASLLIKKGIRPDTIVALMMEPSLHMIVAILAILKAGAAYLPIDPNYPPKRIQHILDDSLATLLITGEKFIKNFSFIALQSYNKPGTQPQPIITPPRSPVKNLDQLQMPHRSLINYEKYQSFIGQAMMKNDITLQFSRGCTYNCAYCFKIWPKKYVNRSAQNMFEEIRFYYNMGIRRFAFVDDLPNLDIKTSSQLYQLIIKNKLNLQLHYVNGIRGDILSKEYIDLMIEAGTVVMDLALETTSPRLQKLIRKNLNLEKLHRNITYIMETYPHVILETAILHGIPTETQEEALDSLQYIKSLQWIHFPYIHLLKIYPNTDMAQLALENGISKQAIADSAHLAYHEIPETLPFSKEFTRKYQSEFFSSYFLSKQRLLKVLPPQMKVFTADELVQAYDGYLPAKIDSLTRLLDYLGISREELPGEFLPEDFGHVPNFNQVLKEHFPAKPTDKNELRILLLDLSQYFTTHTAAGGKQIYDVVEPPLGLMYLLTHLKRIFAHRIKGKIAKSRIDFDSFPALKELLQAFKPHVIGIRSLNFYRDFFHETVSLLRQWGVSAPIIAGGPYATSSFPTMLLDHHIDLAVLGEGEITLAEIIGKILDNQGKLPDETVLKTIPGIAFMEKHTKEKQKRYHREIILLDRLEQTLSHQAAANLPPLNQPGNLSYIIYTSGSSGIPKGVTIQHNNLVNQVSGLIKRFGFDASHHYILLAAFTFDVSVMHIFLPLTTGAKLFLMSEETRKDPVKLWQFIARNRITVLNIVPAFMKTILENLDQKGLHFKYLFVGGDVFPIDLYQALRKTFAAEKIINIYGPTETTINATLYQCKETETGILPIGKPLYNYQAYILNSDLNPVPLGVSGELCISGKGVARGYLNNPELTAEKFLPVSNRFYRFYTSYKTYSSEKIYRTGDLARWLPGGSIQFIGRIDQQVKIRGFRIEPGEIQTHLLKHEALKEAVIATRQDQQGNKSLCAYYVSKPDNQPQLWPSVGEYFIWDELMYYAMTHDQRRNQRFKKTINRCVKNKTLVEVGTGQDAILARFCVEAGAKKVYAVEILEEYCRKAKQTVKKLGMEEKLTVIHGDITKVELPEKVDICLANQCGTIGSSEGAITLHNHARRFLKKGAVVIPHQCITKIAAVTLPDHLHKKPGFTQLPGNYVEKIFKKFKTTFDLRLCIKNFPKDNIISDTGIFEILNFQDMIEEESISGIHLTIKKEARLDGFLMWLNLFTGENELIDTLAEEYVWLPLFIPVFYPGINVSPGDIIKAGCNRYPGDNHFSPDYKIKGELLRTNDNNRVFAYEFPRFKGQQREKENKPRNPFYQRIINGDTITYVQHKGRYVQAAELREYLAGKLPLHMIPSHFVQLEKIPLTSSGKIDKQALPKYNLKTGIEYTAPRNEIEEELVKLWAEVLFDKNLSLAGQPLIGIDDNFFHLGGHSLNATIMTSRIHQAFDVKVPLVEIFKNPVLKELARFIKKAAKEGFQSIEPVENKEYYVMSSAQKRLYILQQMDVNSTVFNMPTVIPLEKEIDKEKLADTFKQLIKRHEILRTSLEMVNEEPVQRIYDEVEFEVEFYNSGREGDRETGNFLKNSGRQANREIGNEEDMSNTDTQPSKLSPKTPLSLSPSLPELFKKLIRPFDLSQAPLLRVALLPAPCPLLPASSILMLDMHHIITDAVSYEIMERDLVSLYNGESLPGLPVQYKDFAEWQNSPGQREKISRQETYWLNEYKGKIPLLNMPLDYTRPEKLTFSGGKIFFEINSELTGKIRSLALQLNVTPMMFLLSLYKLLLAKYTGQQEIVVGTVIAGRRHTDLENIIGFFVNMLAIKTNPDKNKTFLLYLKEVKEKTVNAYDNQEYQFEELVSHLDIERHPGRHPLVSVIFAYLESRQPAPPTQTQQHRLENESLNWWNVSHFDLMLQASATGESILMAFEYSSALFKKSTIAELCNDYLDILNQVTVNPDITLKDIKITLPPYQPASAIIQDNQEDWDM